MQKLLTFFLVLLTAGFLTPGYGQEQAETGQGDAAPKVERISGLYRVAHIEKKSADEYRLHFTAESKDGRHDLLVLNSDGLNVKIDEGQRIRLSAEVLVRSEKAEDKEQEHEITQVLLFLPSQEYGLVPIWMLSNRHETREIRGARWLDMHAPQADYQVF